ncbi:hypothetical protein [Ligilactobacillus ruminis]|uniref:hypothetical protein n=1 Tax=Ligilactobacillus ruminis TaxID=1623 RepID=UPI001561B75F|nr:hypothetical protein [Ligilactobacillus ruminis]
MERGFFFESVLGKCSADGSNWLRESLSLIRFAADLPITGRSQKIAVLPVTGDWILRANPRKCRFARNG